MSPPRVCVVDDDDGFIRLCQQILSTEGYTTECVQDLSKAAAEIEVSRPDVVVLDIRLGSEADGLAVLVELGRADSPTREIPIVICTASLDLLRTHQELIEELGCEIVEKPFDLDTFVGAIRRCLKTREAAA